MEKLDATPNKEQYARCMGQKVKLGNKVVTVVSYAKDGRSGSWERGFKFSTTTYGGLLDSKKQVSFDHGKTWMHAPYDYLYADAWKETPRGDRIRLNAHQSKEFAFDAIQEINRKYEGPDYKWRP